jgi:antitoxin (DNA-binding transcriptional repressor) of toxin-antitoxin stability system
LDLLRHGPIVVTEHGEPLMTVVAVDEDEAEAWQLGQSAEVMALVQQARRQLQQGHGVTLAEMRQELGLKP